MRTSLVLTALVVALATVGCGGTASGAGATKQYVSALNQAQARFAATVQRLSHRVTPTSSAARDRSTLRGFGSAVARVVADLRHIDPPANVARLHGRLVSDLDAFGAQLRSASRALASHDAHRVLDARRRLRVATALVARQLRATIGAINQRLRA